MDWSNERYVRLYVRDTTTWKRLGFEGQSLFCLLIRRVDRAGILEIDNIEPWEAAMLHVSAPEQIAKDGMQRLLDTRVMEHVGTNLVVPNFLEAQEASMSDTMRQKEHRLRRRDHVRAGLDPSQRETAIYFVQSEHGGEIKIGRADDVAKRLVGLQTSRADRLVLLASVPGSLRQERILHEMFSKYRVKGEWFHPSKDLMDFVNDIASRGKTALDERLRSQIVTGHETSAVTLCLAVPSLAVPSEEEGSSQAAPGEPPVAAAKKHRRESPFQTALKDAVEANRFAFGFETKLTAGSKWWAAGATKVQSLVKSGSDMGEAADRVAKAALQLTANGKGFAYALGDCVVMAPGRSQAPAKRPAGIAPPATREEMGPPDDLTDLFGTGDAK